MDPVCSETAANKIGIIAEGLSGRKAIAIHIGQYVPDEGACQGILVGKLSISSASAGIAKCSCR